MAHILYGGVFVKETKAPEGFLLDANAYYVEIAEHGKIYEMCIRDSLLSVGMSL